MNLPQTVRFKRQNVIIVGIIPGPTEPHHDELNNYLEPLVTELSDLWVGVSMSVQIGGTTSFRKKGMWLLELLSFAWLLKVF